jgi:hypothetical protein
MKRSLLYRLAYSTGLRRGELEKLRWSDLKLDSTPQMVIVRAPNAKARKVQEIPLTSWMVPLLQEARKGNEPNDWVFHRPFPHSRVFGEDIELAGIGPVDGQKAVFHSLRHSFVTHLAANGINEAQLFKLARHSDPRITNKVYTHARMLPLAEAVGSLTDLGGGRAVPVENSKQDLTFEAGCTDTPRAQTEGTTMVLALDHGHPAARPVSQGTRSEQPIIGVSRGRAADGRALDAVGAGWDGSADSCAQVRILPAPVAPPQYGRMQPPRPTLTGEAAGGCVATYRIGRGRIHETTAPHGAHPSPAEPSVGADSPSTTTPRLGNGVFFEDPGAASPGCGDGCWTHPAGNSPCGPLQGSGSTPDFSASAVVGRDGAAGQTGRSDLHSRALDLEARAQWIARHQDERGVRNLVHALRLTGNSDALTLVRALKWAGYIALALATGAAAAAAVQANRDPEPTVITDWSW